MDEAKYAEFFPGSAIAESVSNQIPLFGEHAQLWLDSREIVLGTRKNYKEHPQPILDAASSSSPA
ncbi:hypothetical protein [Pseudomonas aeruginosa]|uniref:hypothetical protein n=1 Tax=Pseudomonas aeruginosa TaxID=287 RepID=UPI00106778FC|nr:hypothetical protein [Pseudomonas aeruginosa]TEC44953.1 hypothetical protein IPC1590_25970 [Pseudomonas aeruginosa]